MNANDSSKLKTERKKVNYVEEKRKKKIDLEAFSFSKLKEEPPTRKETVADLEAADIKSIANVGVDLNTKITSVRRKWSKVYPGFNFIERHEEILEKHGQFDLIVNFEVYEHINPELAPALLCAMRKLLKPGGKLIFSTPVYCSSFKMARNHINERTKAEQESDLHQAGFKIIKQYGVFGNVRDFKLASSSFHENEYDELREFYGDDLLGCYLAPKYPEASRNICHVCVTDDTPDVVECELKPSILV